MILSAILLKKEGDEESNIVEEKMGALYSFCSGIGIGLFIVGFSYSIGKGPTVADSILLIPILGVSFVYLYWAVKELRKEGK